MPLIRRDIDWRLDPVHQRQALQAYWSQVPYLEPSCGDHKVVWELNRHQSWLSLGRAYWLSDDTRYRDAFIAYFEQLDAVEPALDRCELVQHARNIAAGGFLAVGVALLCS